MERGVFEAGEVVSKAIPVCDLVTGLVVEGMVLPNLADLEAGDVCLPRVVVLDQFFDLVEESVDLAPRGAVGEVLHERVAPVLYLTLEGTVALCRVAAPAALLMARKRILHRGLAELSLVVAKCWRTVTHRGARV